MIRIQYKVEQLIFISSEPRLKPDECDKLGRNAVHVAAECGQVKAVIKLKQVIHVYFIQLKFSFTNKHPYMTYLVRR